MANTDENRHLHVTFFTEAVKDVAASRAEGRPIFAEQEFIRIRWAGDRKRELVARAHEKYVLQQKDGDHLTYAEVFHEHYAVFRQMKAETVTGTPLEMLTWLRPTRIAELRASSVMTVEALAGLPEGVLGKLGGTIRAEREQAQDWLSATQDAAAINRAAEANAALQARLDAMQAQMEALLAGQAAPAPAAASSDPASWTDEQLRAFLSDRGFPPRANAARDKLIAAVADVMATA